jgi:hypothetical protein
MADEPVATLVFDGTCPDCGQRRVVLPPTLPAAGDDFDWHARDFDSFRRFMLEELFARFPERDRWTDGDLEVVLVEALAAVLDQLSDMADRVAAEAFLETARRPESVRRLLGFIGYDALGLARNLGAGPFAGPPDREDERTDEQRFDRYWLDNPAIMDAARHAGPRAIHRQRRMVTAEDYAIRLEEHPLVRRAHAWSAWSGSWTTVRVAIIGWGGRDLDETGPPPGSGTGEAAGPTYPPDVRAEVRRFHRERGLPWPADADEALFWAGQPSIRTILRPYVDAYRMAGQEALLEDAVPVPVTLALSVLVGERYFRSEVRRAVEETLSTRPGGFFEPGRLRFGENLYAADIYEAVTAMDGVENVCLNRFKRLGGQYADQATSGVIELEGLEIAVCDNDPRRPQRGYYRLELHGGRRG